MHACRLVHTSLDDLIPFADVPAILPRRGGKKVALSTIYRWHQRGLKGVRLEAIQMGGTLATTRDALNRFFAELTQQRLGGPTPLLPTPARRRREIERAERELEAEGL